MPISQFRNRNWIGLVSLVLVSCQPPSKSDPQANEQSSESVPTQEGKINAQTNQGPSPTQTPVADANLVGGTLDMQFVSAGALQISSAALALDRFGYAQGTEIEKIAYQIHSIEICNYLEVNGSGHSNARDCLTVYANHDQESKTPSFPGSAQSNAEFQSGISAMYNYAKDPANAANFVNLVDPEDVKKLSASVQLNSSHVRTYNYGTITWMPAVKIKAKIPIPATTDTTQDPPLNHAATNICTRDSAPLFEKVGGDNYKKIFHPVTDLTCGTNDPAEEAVVVTTSGGTWFAFAQPMAITEEDIAEKRSFKLSLTIDPDGLLRASNTGGTLVQYPSAVTNRDAWDPDHGTHGGSSWGIEIPLISPVPIVHRADQTLVREKYLVHMNFPRKPTYGSQYQENFDIRVQLYYIDEDPTKAIQGVEMLVLPNSQTKYSPPTIYGPRKIVEKENGDILLCTIFSESGNASDGQYSCESSLAVRTSRPSGGMIPYFEGFRRLESMNQLQPIKFRESNKSFCSSDEAKCYGSDPYYEALIDAQYELVAKNEI